MTQQYLALVMHIQGVEEFLRAQSIKGDQHALWKASKQNRERWRAAKTERAVQAHLDKLFRVQRNHMLHLLIVVPAAVGLQAVQELAEDFEFALRAEQLARSMELSKRS
jgi:hypothetical protein